MYGIPHQFSGSFLPSDFSFPLTRFLIWCPLESCSCLLNHDGAAYELFLPRLGSWSFDFGIVAATSSVNLIFSYQQATSSGQIATSISQFFDRAWSSQWSFALAQQPPSSITLSPLRTTPTASKFGDKPSPSPSSPFSSKFLSVNNSRDWSSPIVLISADLYWFSSCSRSRGDFILSILTKGTPFF